MFSELHHKAQVVQGAQAHKKRITLFKEMVEIPERVVAAAGAITPLADGLAGADAARVIHVLVGEPISGEPWRAGRWRAGEGVQPAVTGVAGGHGTVEQVVTEVISGK